MSFALFPNRKNSGSPKILYCLIVSYAPSAASVLRGVYRPFLERLIGASPTKELIIEKPAMFVFSIEDNGVGGWRVSCIEAVNCHLGQAIHTIEKIPFLRLPPVSRVLIGNNARGRR
jgi:hypothetical protein